MLQESRRPSPYQGLIPYTERDSSFFFGREKETRLIIANLYASPLTILYGPSGVGKSSVLRAGVAYQLSQRPNLKVIVHSDWKNTPLTRLKSTIAVLAGLGKNFDTNLSFEDFLKQTTDRTNTRFMFILDQFEEYFLYHPIEDEFSAQFSRAVMRVGMPVSFLISIREDALAKLDLFEGRIPILFDNYLRLEHLDDSAAQTAIEKPIEKYNQLFPSEKGPIQLEAELVKEVLSQLRTGRVSLNKTGNEKMDYQGKSKSIETPYLQLVMTRIWAQEMAAQSRNLRLITLKNLGGAEKIVRSHLDIVMNRLSSDHQLLAAQVFQYLVTPSGTKIALSASDLASFVEAPTSVVRSLLQRLSEKDVRLLRTIEAMEKNEISYEIFHDILASPILDWRERWLTRYKLKRRGLLLAIFSVLAGASIALFTSLMSSYDLTKQSEVNTLLSCTVPFLCTGGLFGLIGFYTGINWARTR